jgi:hypothetical protein
VAVAFGRGDDSVGCESQFFPQVQFLASSLARGEWPWWSPNVFAGWTQTSDPQSLLFSPLHVLLAAFNSAVSLRAFDAVTFAYLFLGGVGIILFFRDRGWHAGGALVAAMAFALAGSANARMQHTGQIISLAYLPLALWLVARALERSSWRAGLAAGAVAGLMAVGRDQVALLSLYVLAGLVLAHWLTGEHPLARLRASIKPLAAARGERDADRRRADHDDHAAGGALEPPRDRLRSGGAAALSTPSTCCNSPSPTFSARWTRASITGRRKASFGTPPGVGRDSISRRIWAGLCRRLTSSP